MWIEHACLRRASRDSLLVGAPKSWARCAPCSPPCKAPLPCVSASDDDIVFEDFARQRLKGMKDDKEDEEERTNSPQLNDR